MTSASTRTEPYPSWDPLFAYNNLPPVSQRAADDARRREALQASRPLTLFQTTALIEAQASSAIEGIVTTAGDMLERMDRPRR